MSLRCGEHEAARRSRPLVAGVAAVGLVVGLVMNACRREQRNLNPPPPHTQAEIDGNAWNLSEGKRLFQWYNCVGCHANGGGGMGPALMDARWIYGSAPEQIFETIEEGRPNGMPSFRKLIPELQAWQLVGYVRSLGGLVPSLAAPGRSDDMAVKPSESSTRPQQPVREQAREP